MAAAVERLGDHVIVGWRAGQIERKGLPEAIAQAVDPAMALSVGLKVDADALPPGILKTADLKSPARARTGAAPATFP
jgi:hypothetical protein